ncbi:MAG: hypothetical protein ABJC05_10905 [Pyrinomonadaceae bacterium]
MNPKWRVFVIVVWLFMIAVQIYEIATTKEGASTLRIITIVSASVAILATLLMWRQDRKKR